MNDLELENLLQSLTPAAPTTALQRRVEHELELDNQWMRAAPAPAQQRQKVPRWLPATSWGALGAAAAVLVMGLVPDRPQTPTPTAAAVAALTPQSSVMPMTTIREVVDAQDQGIQYNTLSRLPEQHVKLVSVERHAWIDPRDGAEITVEVPREESVILPVSFQ
jgi:anti-sigma-K factor RskA